MVTFILISYNETNDIHVSLGSLLVQKNPDWKAIVYHDGPNPETRKRVEAFNDPRITYVEAPENLGAWGAYNRIDAINNLVDTKYVLQATVQEYFLPNCVDEILKVGGDFIYWPVVHHSFDYRVLYPELRIGKIDWCSFAVKTSIAKTVGIKKPDSYVGDGLFVQDCVQSGLMKKITHIEKILSIKN